MKKYIFLISKTQPTGGDNTDMNKNVVFVFQTTTMTRNDKEKVTSTKIGSITDSAVEL